MKCSSSRRHVILPNNNNWCLSVLSFWQTLYQKFHFSYLINPLRRMPYKSSLRCYVTKIMSIFFSHKRFLYMLEPNGCRVLSVVNLNWLDPEVLPIFLWQGNLSCSNCHINWFCLTELDPQHIRDVNFSLWLWRIQVWLSIRAGRFCESLWAIGHLEVLTVNKVNKVGLNRSEWKSLCLIETRVRCVQINCNHNLEAVFCWLAR